VSAFDPNPETKPAAFVGGGQVESNTDTRIFSTAESPVRRGQAEERREISSRPTEPPRPTEPIPNRKAEILPNLSGSRLDSRGYE
jgi:hypothetical protein